MPDTSREDILLHTCCGPCASACIERLRQEGREPAVFFSNANIAPDGEYEKRLDSARRLAAETGVEFIEDRGVSHDEWLEKVARGFESEPEGGERCRRCFEFNLSRAAAFAAGHSFREFTTSLTVSPHKRSATVFEAGRAAAESQPSTSFAPFDFKKGNGFLRSIALAKQFGLYRQTWCGCEFSRRADPAPQAAPSQAFNEFFMKLALEEAEKARLLGEVPTGCVIIRRPDSPDAAPDENMVIARAHNMTETDRNPTAHAEMLAISEAARAVGDFRLADTILYVTKEPCAMCAGAVVLARIPVVVWGMSDKSRGGQSAFGILSSKALIHRAATVAEVLEPETSRMIKDFFRSRRRGDDETSKPRDRG